MTQPALLTVALHITPITLREARAFVDQHHRHHRAPQGGIVAIALAVEGADEPCGVAILGRPVARHLNDGWTAEITRLCVLPGVRNGCSRLYGGARRRACALGYRRLVTYTLASEGGASLRGAGYRLIGESPGGTWSRRGRPRVDAHPTEPKLIWEVEP